MICLAGVVLMELIAVSCGGETHSLVFVRESAPTCTAEGNIAYWHCSDCGLDFLDGEGRQPAADVSVRALGHALVSTVVAPAGCETDGTVRVACSRCDYERSETLSATGHRYGAYAVELAPTCTQDGLEARYCASCSARETRTVKALGHDLDVENRCRNCGLTFAPTEGLAFTRVIENGVIGYEVGIGTAEEQSVVIPRYFGGSPVVGIAKDGFRESGVRAVAIFAQNAAIGEGAFYGCSRLREVIFGDGVTKIGARAFWGCRLNAAELPDSVTELGDYAFYSNADLKTLRIGSGLTRIGRSAFWGCGALETIEVAEDNPVYLGEGNCLISRGDGTLLLGSNRSVIPDLVTAIADNAFLGCAELERINIPASVKTIGNFAFRDCTRLADIDYAGTKDEWNAIDFGKEWNVYNAVPLTVHCTDGTIVYGL